MQGIIIKGIGGFYYVKAEDGSVYECRARGIFRKEKIKPMIGDKVIIEIIDSEHGNIEQILPRSTHLIRPGVANIDLLVVVAAAKNPDPDFYFIDKLLVMAEARKINPAICVNKTDLASAAIFGENYKNTSYPIFEVCAESGKLPDSLKDFLKGKTTAFAGLSGVGKSSILSILTGQSIQTGDISEKIRRGKHTTRHTELFELDNGGYVLDTPGFSSFEAEIMTPAELCGCFPEMYDFLTGCRFSGCAHINEPDCLVKNAVNDGLISEQRYDSYKKIYETLKQIKQWEL